MSEAGQEGWSSLAGCWGEGYASNAPSELWRKRGGPIREDLLGSGKDLGPSPKGSDMLRLAFLERSFWIQGTDCGSSWVIPMREGAAPAERGGCEGWVGSLEVALWGLGAASPPPAC